MPIMRATVTVDEAVPYACTATASTAAVDRGVTVSPKPNAEQREREGGALDGGGGCPAGHLPQPDDAGTQPDDRHQLERQEPHREPGQQRPHGRRSRQGPQRQPLLVGTAVEHPVHEHRGAHDRRGEAVPGEQRRPAPPTRTTPTGTAAGPGTGRGHAGRARSSPGRRSPPRPARTSEIVAGSTPPCRIRL